MNLSGKVAIVTGAAQGIGMAVARRFLTDGARVMLFDIDERKLAQTREKLEDSAPAADAVESAHGDVGERLDVHNMVAATLDAFDDIDILVNNAGIVHAADFLDLAEEDFDRVMRVNLKGAFLCTQAVARHMVEQAKADGGDEDDDDAVAGFGGARRRAGRGSIVNMSSVNARLSIANQVPYSVSKGGMRQLTNVAAQALAPHGIRVNAVGPGSIATEMLRAVNADPDARRRILARTPMGRLGEPDEIAAVVSFLASDEASYVTGQTIYADGGRLGLNYTVEVGED